MSHRQKTKYRKYDFSLAWPDLEKIPFIEWLKQECKEKKLAFLQIHDGNVASVIQRIENRRLRLGFLLDMNATYNLQGNLYARLCYATKDAGCKVVDDPVYAQFSLDKSATHNSFIDASIPVPHTIIVRNWQFDRLKITDSDKRRLGVPFIIKPAFGYGGKGVIRDAEWRLEDITRARNYDRTDNFLLQEKITPVSFGDREAWFRVFYLFGEIMPCWWDTKTGEYNRVTRKEYARYKLRNLMEIPLKIARITRMEWFSTEIAYSRRNRSIGPVAVDYINDQCDMGVKSQDPTSPPDALVKYITKKMVKVARLVKDKKKLTNKPVLKLATSRSV